MKIPLNAGLNAELTAIAGRDVIFLESIPVVSGEKLLIRFLSHGGPYKQGLWLGVEGSMEVAGQQSPQVTLWVDTAPPEVPLRIVDTKDERLRFYNVYDAGRGRISLSRYCGMIKDTDGPKTTYRCKDIDPEPVFDRLVFEVVRQPLPSGS
jgi:hypothetical protein